MYLLVISRWQTNHLLSDSPMSARVLSILVFLSKMADIFSFQFLDLLEGTD